MESFDFERAGGFINMNFHLLISHFSSIRSETILPDRYEENVMEGNKKQHQASLNTRGQKS